MTGITAIDDIERLSWPRERLDEAVAALARKCGLNAVDSRFRGNDDQASIEYYPFRGNDEQVQVEHCRFRGKDEQTSVERCRDTRDATENQDTAESWATTENQDTAESRARMESRMEIAALRLGLEAEPLNCSYGEVDDLLRRRRPAILLLQVSGRRGTDDQGNVDAAPSATRSDQGSREARVLLLLDGGAGDPRGIPLLGPDLGVQRRSVEIVRQAICRELEASARPEVEAMLEAADVAPERRRRAGEAIRRRRLGTLPVEAGWELRLPPGADPWRQARRASLARLLIAFIGAHTAQYGLFVLSWYLLGKGALEGRIDTGLLLSWALVLLAIIPFRLLATWSQGRLSARGGALLKQRLLYGALRLTPEEIRHQGVGQLLGRVIESEAVETLALSGGFLGLVAVIELAVAAFVLANGAGGLSHLLLLIIWLFLVGALAWRYYRQRREWTDARLDLTHDLVEQMEGHRTRLAQEPWNLRHGEEVAALGRYQGLSRRMDRVQALLVAAPRGWVIAGTLGLAPVFLAGADGPALAVAIGGILLAAQALEKLVPGLSHLAAATIAWRRVAELFAAAARRESVGAMVSGPGEAVESREGNDRAGDTQLCGSSAKSAVVLQPAPRGAKATALRLRSPLKGARQRFLARLSWLRRRNAVQGNGNEAPRGHNQKTIPDLADERLSSAQETTRTTPILAARDVVFRYRPDSEAVLERCSLEINAGERILLEGPSGGGKSTLASLLVGLRQPESGSLQLRGLERSEVGDVAWRWRVVAAPQFHENHVLTETFAFNLLMGRRWPPRAEDAREALAICQELGLGELLAKMPGGMLQMVGETGWQLSHGERSRLYIARALLQRADVIVLDESFAALDPESLRQALSCVLKRAPALVVIAHP
jgi:ATP-binding cassette subfamily B protein